MCKLYFNFDINYVFTSSGYLITYHFLNIYLSLMYGNDTFKWLNEFSSPSSELTLRPSVTFNVIRFFFSRMVRHQTAVLSSWFYEIPPPPTATHTHTHTHTKENISLDIKSNQEPRKTISRNWVGCGYLVAVTGSTWRFQGLHIALFRETRLMWLFGVIIFTWRCDRGLAHFGKDRCWQYEQCVRPS